MVALGKLTEAIMLETLLGGILGGVLRLVPELLKWLDRAGERKHELSMQDKVLEFERLRGAGRMAELKTGAEAAWQTGALEALRTSLEGQGKVSGVAWIDALSISVRPIITYWFMALYCGTKIILMYTSLAQGADMAGVAGIVWTGEDMVIWSGMLNFWFLGRVFEKMGRP